MGPCAPQGSGAPALVLLARPGCRRVAPELHYSLLSLAHPILPSLCLWVTSLGDFPVPEQWEGCWWLLRQHLRAVASPALPRWVQSSVGLAQPPYTPQLYCFTFP